jgi:adenosine deaminase
LGPLEGAENVELAGSFSRKYPNIVLGMDLSGDPTKGSCEWIIPLLDRARKSGLPLSVHLPEVSGVSADTLLGIILGEYSPFQDLLILTCFCFLQVVQLEETRKMLEFLPERVGHGLYLHPSLGGTQDLWEFVKRSKIPIGECCAC